MVQEINAIMGYYSRVIRQTKQAREGCHDFELREGGSGTVTNRGEWKVRGTCKELEVAEYEFSMI